MVRFPSLIRAGRRSLARLPAAALLLTLLGAQRCTIAGLSEVGAPQPADRILVVAPHVDDEMIAAGGYLLDARAAHATVYVVYLTSGDNNRTTTALADRRIDPKSADFLKQGKARMAEARDALEKAGIPAGHAYFLGYPDRRLSPMLKFRDRTFVSPGTRERSVPYPDAVSPGAEYRFENLWNDFQKVLRETRPNIVVAPVEFDAHPDHRAGGVLAREAVHAWNPKVRMLRYLVHAADFPQPFRPKRGGYLVPSDPLMKYDWSYYPLDDATERQKGEVLRSYKTQRRDPYLVLLMDAFVRKNELFIEEGNGGEVEPVPEGMEDAR